MRRIEKFRVKSPPNMLIGNPIVKRTKPYKLWDGFGHVLEIIRCGIRRRDCSAKGPPVTLHGDRHSDDDEKRDLPELRDYVLKTIALKQDAPDDAQKMGLWKIETCRMYPNYRRQTAEPFRAFRKLFPAVAVQGHRNVGLPPHSTHLKRREHSNSSRTPQHLAPCKRKGRLYRGPSRGHSRPACTGSTYTRTCSCFPVILAGDGKPWSCLY